MNKVLVFQFTEEVKGSTIGYWYEILRDMAHTGVIVMPHNMEMVGEYEADPQIIVKEPSHEDRVRDIIKRNSEKAEDWYK